MSDTNNEQREALISILRFPYNKRARYNSISENIRQKQVNEILDLFAHQQAISELKGRIAELKNLDNEMAKQINAPYILPEIHKHTWELAVLGWKQSRRLVKSHLATLNQQLKKLEGKK